MKKLFLFMFVLAACGKDPVTPPSPPAPAPLNPADSKVMIGSLAIAGHTYLWSPIDGLDNPALAQPTAGPKKTTLYTVTATNPCGQASGSVLVRVFKNGSDGELVEVK